MSTQHIEEEDKGGKNLTQKMLKMKINQIRTFTNYVHT